MALSERIDKIVEYSGLSIPQFSKRVGFKTPQTIRELIKGNTKSLSYQVQDKLKSAYPELNMIWLLTGEGEMLMSDKEIAKVVADDDNALWLPVINLDTRGGLLPNMETDTIQYDTMQMPFSRNIARDGDFVMPVVGDSMTPKYPNGTYVLVRPLPTWREYIELGATYVLELIDGRRVIKDVRAGDDKEHFRLYSVNPTFDPTEIAKSFISHIFAVIVAVRRELNW